MTWGPPLSRQWPDFLFDPNIADSDFDFGNLVRRLLGPLIPTLLARACFLFAATVVEEQLASTTTSTEILQHNGANPLHVCPAETLISFLTMLALARVMCVCGDVSETLLGGAVRQMHGGQELVAADPHPSELSNP